MGSTLAYLYPPLPRRPRLDLDRRYIAGSQIGAEGLARA